MVRNGTTERHPVWELLKEEKARDGAQHSMKLTIGDQSTWALAEADGSVALGEDMPRRSKMEREGPFLRNSNVGRNDQ